jgi:hypothetical protein
MDQPRLHSAWQWWQRWWMDGVVPNEPVIGSETGDIPFG